jgi:hypothetical protein
MLRVLVHAGCVLIDKRDNKFGEHGNVYYFSECI